MSIDVLEVEPDDANVPEPEEPKDVYEVFDDEDGADDVQR